MVRSLRLPMASPTTNWAGPENGRPVVLVHGFSSPYFIFDTTFEFLVNSGFRVLRYDLFGRGYSDRPRTDYNIHLFVRQLKDLLDALGFKQVNLVGLSMGGAISAAFISQYPDHVSRQVLIDPAGANKCHCPGMLKALKTAHLWRTGFRSVWKREHAQGHCI